MTKYMQNLKRINSKNTENSTKIQYISSALYPIAPVTNYQNITALKQQQYINLQFWVSLGVGKMTYFLKVLGKNPYPGLSQLLEAILTLFLWPLPSAKLETATQIFPRSHCTNNFLSCLPRPLLPDAGNYIGHTCLTRIISLN